MLLVKIKKVPSMVAGVLAIVEDDDQHDGYSIMDDETNQVLWRGDYEETCAEAAELAKSATEMAEQVRQKLGK